MVSTPSRRRLASQAARIRSGARPSPPGWPNLPAYLAELAVSLRRLHGLQAHPLYQSLRHGTPTTHNLLRSDDPAIRAFFQAGEFPEGSMGPKIRAAIEFLDRGGEEVVITSLANLSAAVDGEGGTHITRNDGRA